MIVMGSVTASIQLQLLGPPRSPAANEPPAHPPILRFLVERCAALRDAARKGKNYGEFCKNEPVLHPSVSKLNRVRATPHPPAITGSQRTP